MDATQRTLSSVSGHLAASLTGRPAAGGPVDKAAVSGMATPVQSVQPQRVERVEVRFNPEEMQKRLREVVDEMNARMRETNRNLSFGVDNEVGRFVIKVTNRDSGELVRQIPGEAVLAVAHSIEDLKGILYEDFV